MSRYFQGLNSFPHGTKVTLGLIFASAAAWAMTSYSVASCHYVTVNFESYRGNVFDGPLQAAGSVGMTYHVAAGLFTWASSSSSSNGDTTCVSYTQYQLTSDSILADPYLQAARAVGVFAVVIGLIVLLSSLFLPCISLGQCQCRLYRLSCLSLVLLVGLTQLINSSSLCQSFGNCHLNNGGLVSIAALLLWMVSLVVAVVYVHPPSQDVIVENGVETNLFQRRQERRQARQQSKHEEQQRKQQEKEFQRQQNTEQKQELTPATWSNDHPTESANLQHSTSLYNVQDDASDELEVCLNEVEEPVLHGNSRV